MKKWVFSLLITTCTAGSLLAAPQAIVFDFGGVLTGNPDREAVVHFIRQTHHLSEAEFEKANQEKRLAMKDGKTDEEFWIAYAKEHGVQLPSNWSESFHAVMKKAVGANPEMFALVDRLKEEKVPVALLSNIDARLSKLIRSFGYYEQFDPCLLSHEIGVEKPDPKAFEVLLKELKFPAQDVVFIDDKLENVQAAKALGIDAIVFESTDQIKRELAQRGTLKD
ncbi:MAG: HAD family phosphatase [Verrucomicrobia bacterium]|nr:HAD family phosphatase [Verrucomicrobiota bacterium]